MFSAKVRAYFRLKADQQDLGRGFEEILATPNLIQNRLQKRSGSPSLPQAETPDGVWLQDTSEIIDHCEQAHRGCPVIPAEDMPRQRLASYLIELLADEWVLVPACWERWQFSLAGQEPNHRAFNEQQWGSFLKPELNGRDRAAAGAHFFRRAFGIDDDKLKPRGPYMGLVDLGCTEHMVDAWQASLKKILDALEAHLSEHDYLLGGRPSLGDFSLLGPIYVHFYRDAVPGFILRTCYPLVTEWVERTNSEGCLNARRYGKAYYEVDEHGDLIEQLVLSDGGNWLSNDEVPASLNPLFEVFFSEMWPYLKASIEALRSFIHGEHHELGGELPRKSFTASPGFEAFQRAPGVLNVSFELGGMHSRRMVVPAQIWMLQRIQGAMQGASTHALHHWLDQFPNGREFAELQQRLAGVQIDKRGGLLYSHPA